MAQASIHFEPVKGGSEEHNRRLKFLDYVHPDRTRLNQYWETDTQAHRLEVITQNYLEHHPKRKKLHAKATPIREAVVNITEDTTPGDLVRLADRLHVRFGIEVFQFAIHRDEGYANSKDGLKLNLHAHLVADWTDHEKGESIKLSRQDMAEMQTICAEVLHMERGVSSDKKHLTAMQFKEQKAKEEAEKAIKQKDAMTAKCVNALRTNAQQLQELEGLKQEASEVAQEVQKMRSELLSATSSVTVKEAEKKAIEGEISGLKAEKMTMETDKDSLQDDIRELKREKTSITAEVEVAKKEQVSIANAWSQIFRSNQLPNIVQQVLDIIEKAVQAICALANTPRWRSFTRQEAAIIDAALGTEDRLGMAKELTDKAHDRESSYNAKAYWYKIARQEVEKIAEHGLQNYAEEQQWTRGINR